MTKSNKILRLGYLIFGVLFALFFIIGDLSDLAIIIQHGPKEFLGYQIFSTILAFLVLVDIGISVLVCFGKLQSKAFDSTLILAGPAFGFAIHEIVINKMPDIFVPQIISYIAIILIFGSRILKGNKAKLARNIIITIGLVAIIVANIILFRPGLILPPLTVLGFVLYILSVIYAVVILFFEDKLTPVVRKLFKISEEADVVESAQAETKKTKESTKVGTIKETNKTGVGSKNLTELNEAIAKYRNGEISLEEYREIKERCLKNLYK
jgi:hypothetical protein